MIINSTINQNVNKELKQIPSDEIVDENDRLVDGWVSVEVKDSDGELLPIDEMAKEMPTWMKRGAPIMDTHTNKQVGKGIEWHNATHPETGKPGIKMRYRIYQGKKLDDIVWNEIKTNKRKGLSWGGLSWDTPEIAHDKYSGERAKKLHGLEQYEVSSVRDPSNSLALNDAVNFIAKSKSELPPRGTGRLNNNADPQETGTPRTDEERQARHSEVSKPVGEYLDFDECVRANQDKDSPEAYCAALEHKITGKWPAEEINHALKGDIKGIRGDTMADKSVKKEAPIEGESQPATLDDRVAALEGTVESTNGAVSDIKEMLTKMAAPAEPVKPVEETKEEEKPKEPEKPAEEEKEEPEKKPEEEPKEEKKPVDIEEVAKRVAEEVVKKSTEKSSTPRPTATPKKVEKNSGVNSWSIIEQSRQPNTKKIDVKKMADRIRTEAEALDFDNRQKFHEVMKGARVGM